MHVPRRRPIAEIASLHKHGKTNEDTRQRLRNRRTVTRLHALLQRIPRRYRTCCLRAFDTGSPDSASHPATLHLPTNCGAKLQKRWDISQARAIRKGLHKSEAQRRRDQSGLSAHQRQATQHTAKEPTDCGVACAHCATHLLGLNHRSGGVRGQLKLSEQATACESPRVHTSQRKAGATARCPSHPENGSAAPSPLPSLSPDLGGSELFTRRRRHISGEAAPMATAERRAASEVARARSPCTPSLTTTTAQPMLRSSSLALSTHPRC